MGTEVIVKLQNKVLSKTFEPGARLASNVYSTVSSFQSQVGGGALSVSSVVFTEDQLPVDNWKERLVGLKPLTVVVEAPQTFQDQMASMLKQMHSLNHKVSIISKPCVANLAAQILLLACKIKEFEKTSTRYFSELGSEHSSVKLFCDVLQVQPQIFVRQANALVRRRNNKHIHFVSREALDKEVAEVLDLITQICEMTSSGSVRLLKTMMPSGAAFRRDDLFCSHQVPSCIVALVRVRRTRTGCAHRRTRFSPGRLGGCGNTFKL